MVRQFQNTTQIRSVYHPSPFGQTSFHWLEAGWQNGETVIMLHGIMAHSMCYRRVVEDLAQHYHVVLADMPGHGRDQTFRDVAVSPGVTSLVDWLLALVETISAARPTSKIHVVGHSLGALVASLAAAQTPQIETLSLVSPGLIIPVPSWTSPVLGRLPVSLARLGANRLGLSVYQPIQWKVHRMSTREKAAYLRPLQDTRRLEYILRLGSDLVRQEHAPDHRIQAPTLLIWGTRDHLLPIHLVGLIEERVGVDTTILLDCGHCPMEDSPREFNRSLLSFLQDTSHQPVASVG